MNLIYFKSPLGNFGDDLNPWLWQKIFGNFQSYEKDLDFVGIGSILDNRLDSKNKKIIFGSGVRNFFPGLQTDNYDFRFVRGPISSKILGGVPFITDSAYCMGLLEKGLPIPVKKHKCSIIPYFRHVKSLNWQLMEKLTGIHFIDVTKPVEEVLLEIASSEKIICGAMHGAIAADVLRIPWTRLVFGKHGYETTLTSELKWNDWLYSMGISETMNKEISPVIFEEHKIGKIFSSQMQFFETLITLRRNSKFYLSDEDVFKRRIEELEREIYKLKKEYKK